MKFSKKIWLKISLALLTIIALFLSLFFYPQPIFAWSVESDNLSLYSDQPFPAEDGRLILEQVQAKLAASPLYSSQDHYAIFICNTKWRRSIYFVGDYRAGGLVYYPISSNVFLSGAVVEENRLISPSGMSDMLGRKLDHFIAHEIAHILTGRATGWSDYYHLPIWIKEGYAEYIGSSDVFNYEEATEAFMTNASEMNSPSAAPYLRYNLLIAYLLEERKWSSAKLFETSLSQNEVETTLKTEISLKNKD